MFTIKNQRLKTFFFPLPSPTYNGLILMFLSSDILLKSFTKVELTFFLFVSALGLCNGDSAPLKYLI